MESSNKRLAKNTIIMYARMLLLLVVSLYTSRVVLQVLGISDFGLYSLVNSIVISFSFVNTSLIGTARRYLAFSLGRGNEEEYNRVFCSCTTLFIIAGFMITLLLIPIGLWLIGNRLNIPEDRTYAARILLLSVGVTFFLSFVKAAYHAVIISHERMGFYAFTGIAEAVMKLIIVYLLVVIPIDKLMVYGFLQALLALVFLAVCIVYAMRYLNTRYSFVYDKKLFRELSAFSGWSLYDGVASIGKVEFINLIINSFFGVVVNAAVGVAKQVNAAVNSFTSNFITAYSPQITKSYAGGDYDRLNYLIINTSKFSGAIFFMIAIPLCVNIQDVLQLWLGVVPRHADCFVCFLLLSSGLEALSGPFWITGYAIGNIRNLQCVTGTLRLIPVPFVYLYFIHGGPVDDVFITVVISDLLIYIYRISYLKSKMNFDVSGYMNHIYRLLLIIGSVIVVTLLCKRCVDNPLARLMSSVLVSVICFSVMTYYLLMNRHQRKSILNFASR